MAGTPDHHDMEIVNNYMNKIIGNNNNQVIINSLFTNKINQLIKNLNTVMNSKKPTDKILEYIILKLQYIDEELTNIAYAIHWAKNDIINPFLLSREEIEAALSEIDENNYPYSTIEEAFNIATIKLATHKNNILYIIDIPIVHQKSFNVLTLKSNGLSKPTIDLKYKKILYNHEIIYGIKESCKMINQIAICQQNEIVDITNSSCIPNIMKGTHATCSETKTNLTTTVELLNEGILLLNNFNGNITQNCNNYHYNLNGTFLLKFNNCTININGQLFISKEVEMNKKSPQTFITTSWTSKNRDELTMEQLQELHINNTEIIEFMNYKINFHSWNHLMFYILIILSIMIYCYIKYKKNQIIKIKPTIETIAENILLKNIQPTTIILETKKVTGNRI